MRYVPGCAKAVTTENRPASSVHPLNDQVVKHHLLLRSLNDVLLHAVLGHQTVHADLSQSTQPSVTTSTHTHRSAGNLQVISKDHKQTQAKCITGRSATVELGYAIINILYDIYQAPPVLRRHASPTSNIPTNRYLNLVLLS